MVSNCLLVILLATCAIISDNATDISVVLSYNCVCVYFTICDRILENSSKSHMKSSVFLYVFNDISTCVYVFTEYFLHSFSNLSIEFLVVL